MNKGGLVAEVAKRTGLSARPMSRGWWTRAIDAIRDVGGARRAGDARGLRDVRTQAPQRAHRAEPPASRMCPIVVPARDLPAFTPGKEFRAQVLGCEA